MAVSAGGSEVREGAGLEGDWSEIGDAERGLSGEECAETGMGMVIELEDESESELELELKFEFEFEEKRRGGVVEMVDFLRGRGGGAGEPDWSCWIWSSERPLKDELRTRVNGWRDGMGSESVA